MTPSGGRPEATYIKPGTPPRAIGRCWTPIARTNGGKHDPANVVDEMLDGAELLNRQAGSVTYERPDDFAGEVGPEIRPGRRAAGERSAEGPRESRQHLAAECHSVDHGDGQRRGANVVSFCHHHRAPLRSR